MQRKRLLYPTGARLERGHSSGRAILAIAVPAASPAIMRSVEIDPVAMLRSE